MNPNVTPSDHQESREQETQPQNENDGSVAPRGNERAKPAAQRDYQCSHKPHWLDYTNTVLLFVAFVAAAAAAKFTWQQVVVAKDTANKELRAYVSVESAANIAVSNGEVTEIPLRIVNAGQTPALNLAFGARGFQEVPAKFSSEGVCYAPRELQPAKLGFLPSNANRSFPTDYKIRPKTLDESGHRIYSLGIVYYDDIFGASHWTSFCLSWGGKRLGPENAILCDKHNETDLTSDLQLCPSAPSR